MIASQTASRPNGLWRLMRANQPSQFLFFLGC
jgi:hypothetical protein